MIVQPVEALRPLRLMAEAPPQAQPVLALALPTPEPSKPLGLIGRERELAVLRALVEQAPETGSALLIRGAAGTGKSALVAALVEDVRDQPVEILRASGIRAEANLPYAGLHQLLRPILGELGSLPRPQRRAIEAAFGIIASPSPDPLLVAIGTLDLLAKAARPGLVAIVEDAQWLDRRTSEVLSFVARRLASDPIVLLVTARDDRRSPILEAGLDELCLEGLGDAEGGDPPMTQPVDLADVTVDDEDAMLARRMLSAAAQYARWESGDQDAGRSAGRMAAPIDAQPDDPSLLAISAALGSADPASTADAAGTSEHGEAAASDLLLVGISAAIAGDVARSRPLLAKAAPMLRDDDDRRPLAQLLVMQAWNDIHLGRWTEAASELAEGAGLARETEQAMSSLLADLADALLAAMRGDEETVDLALARIGSAAGVDAQGWLASSIQVVRGICDLNAGRADASYTRLRDQLTVSDDASLWPIDHFADAAVLTGQMDEGRAILAARGDVAEERLGPLQSAGLIYARALLADESEADERQAQAIADLATWPVHLARLQLHRGAWLRRHRRVADSRVPLRAARDVFESLGAAPLAERARRELRASGERSRQRDVTAWDQLSPQESEIAHMAAKGLSNREIAERLFLSHRTVGAHLYRIFPKLGVTSRGQLHTVLAAGVDGAAVVSPYGI